MIYVTSDIHGNWQRFQSILDQIDLAPEDTLYILGDVIDRFPDGGRILRRIMKMPNARLLMGNHEWMMYTALCPDREVPEWEREENLEIWYQNGGGVTHNYLKHLRKDARRELLEYVRRLPLQVRIQVEGREYRLVHAAPVEWYPRYAGEYGSPVEFAVWHRILQRPDPEEKYTLIVGHTPTAYLQADHPSQIWRGEGILDIDCGCGTRYGRLACLRLEDGEVFYSRDPEEG